MCVVRGVVVGVEDVGVCAVVVCVVRGVVVGIGVDDAGVEAIGGVVDVVAGVVSGTEKTAMQTTGDSTP